MTAIAEHPVREVDLGHPVRSFTAVLIASALVLVVVQWSGFANPRLHPTSVSGGYADGPIQTFTIEVQNDSPLPLEITALDWPTTNMASAEAGVVPSSGQLGVAPPGAPVDPFEPFTIDGGTTAWLGITVVPRCSAGIGSPRVEVRTPSGLRHQVDLDRGGFDVGEPCE
jgi:hypothetical protein